MPLVNSIITTIIFFYLGYCSFTDIKKRIVYIFPTIIISIISISLCLYNSLISNNISGFLLSFIPGVILIIFSFITRENIGYGDSIVLALCCIATNFWNGIFIITTSFIYSALYSVVLLLLFRGKNLKNTIPFVPFIFLGYTSFLFTNL